MKMNILQSMRRLGQQLNGSGLFNSIDAGAAQFNLIKKLYARNGLDIQMTCPAMPEQYDVFKDGAEVGYYRLRHGSFTVDYPKCGEEEIYEAYPDGDGCFESYERLKYLTIAMRQLLNKIHSQPNKTNP